MSTSSTVSGRSRKRGPAASAPAAPEGNPPAVPPGAASSARDLIDPAVRQILDDFRLESVGSHLMRRVHFMAEELFAQEFAGESLTPRQKAALVIVYQQPGLNQNALADRLFMDRNTVAEMVKRLARTGLLKRVSAKDDQRAYELFLAPAGAQLLNRVMPRDIQVERRVLERLPEEYRPLFVKCLHMLVAPPARESDAA
jgi:DNA-binding MarR family transcriptional regulator